jgi:hypothetical protein
VLDAIAPDPSLSLSFKLNFADSACCRYYTLCAVGEQGAPGCQWQSAGSWPPENSRAAVYSFGGNASLFTSSKVSGINGFKNITFDPSSPSPTIGGANLDPKFGQ